MPKQFNAMCAIEAAININQILAPGSMQTKF